MVFFQVGTFQYLTKTIAPLESLELTSFGSCLTWFDLGVTHFWNKELQVDLFTRLQTVINHLFGGIRAGSLAGCLETTHLWPGHLSSALRCARTGDTKLGLGSRWVLMIDDATSSNKMKQVPKKDTVSLPKCRTACGERTAAIGCFPPSIGSQVSSKEELPHPPGRAAYSRSQAPHLLPAVQPRTPQ